MPKRWTADEKAFVRDNYKSLTANGVAEVLGRTKASIQHAAQRLDAVVKVRGDLWTPEQDDLLRRLYQTVGSIPLANQLGRTPIAVRHRANRIGLKFADEGCKKNLRIRQVATRQINRKPRCLENWKRRVKTRDDFVCQDCGLREPLIVTAHHIKPISEGGDKFDVDNGVTLCPNCHAMRHARDGRATSGRRFGIDVRERVMELFAEGMSVTEISTALNCNFKTVLAIQDRMRA